MHNTRNTFRLETAYQDLFPALSINKSSPYPGLPVSENPRPSDYYAGIQTDGRLDIEKTDLLFKNLAHLMLYQGAQTPYGFFGDNEAIPAGYTYLAQFAAHDLTINSEMRPNIDGAHIPVNMRTEALMLETLYGRGPVVCAHCYDYADRFSGVDACLSLNPVNVPASGVGAAATETQPHRDIARHHDYNAQHRKRRGRALIADARNDAHSVIAQLTALFSQFHNLVVAQSKLQHTDGDIDTHFNYARAVVTVVYRSILRNDMLRRLLDPEIYGYYNKSANEDRFLFALDKSSPISSEFVHAAYRIGHSMVRPFYRMSDRNGGAAFPLEEVLHQNSDGDASKTPLDPNWIISWSHFFPLAADGEASPTQASSLIGPLYMQKLNSKLTTGLHQAGDTLAYLDLLRTISAPVLRVDRLRAHIADASQKPGFPDESRARIADAGAAEAAVRAFAGRRTKAFSRETPLPPRLDDAMLDDLCTNPPLGLYVLIEANSGPGQGRHLGPLGSILLAETFFRILDDSGRLDRMPLPGGMTPQIAAKLFFEQKGPDPVPQSMPELIRWIDRNLPQSEKELGDGSPLPFI
ncbi:peroxidase family protein [Roseibium sp. M-1]